MERKKVKKTKSEIINDNVKKGEITINDARAKLGLSPIDNADTKTTQLSIEQSVDSSS